MLDYQYRLELLTQKTNARKKSFLWSSQDQDTIALELFCYFLDDDVDSSSDIMK